MGVQIPEGSYMILQVRTVRKYPYIIQFKVRILVFSQDADTSNVADLTVPWKIICFLVVPNWFLCTEVVNDDTRIFLCYCGVSPRNLSAVPESFDECAPHIPVSGLLGRSGFVNAIGSVEAAASDGIQEITFLGFCLMWNDAAVCNGRIRLKIL